MRKLRRRGGAGFHDGANGILKQRQYGECRCRKGGVSSAKWIRVFRRTGRMRNGARAGRGEEAGYTPGGEAVPADFMPRDDIFYL